MGFVNTETKIIKHDLYFLFQNNSFNFFLMVIDERPFENLRHTRTSLEPRGTYPFGVA